MAYKLYNNSISKLIINVIPSVLDSDDAAALEVADDGDGFAGVTSEREQEGIEFLVIGVNFAYDVFFSVLGFTKGHLKFLSPATVATVGI